MAQSTLRDTKYDVVQGADEVRFQEFLDLFDRLKELPKLQSVVLGVYRKFGIQGYGDIGRGQKTNRFRSATKSRFISSLSAFSRVPRELSIHDLPSVHETGSVAVSVLEKVLGGLQSLQLHILLEWDASIVRRYSREPNPLMLTSERPQSFSTNYHHSG